MEQPEKQSKVMTVEGILTKLKMGETTALDVIDSPFGGKGVRVEVIREPWKRAETAKKAHVYNDCEGFIEYLKGYGEGAGSSVRCDMGLERFTSVLDETAELGTEVIQFVPILHPVFRAIR